MIIISWILNFPIIDGELMKYEKLGGYISRPIIFILNSLFGGKAIAIKVFFILMLIVVIARILYSLNFSLPKFNINLQHEEKPKEKQKVDGRKQKVDDDEEEETKPQTIDHGFIRTLLKDKFKKELHHKIEIKEVERTAKTPDFAEKVTSKARKNTINFSSDKPTYSTTLLDTNPGETVTIDETFLMEKAKALQDKLLEFNVPITIEGFDIGPSIVQIRIKPDSGIRIATLEGLTHDIALSLKSKSLRIVAPIPWTDCVGIQIPNPKPMMVRLWDVLNTSDFADDMKKSDNNLGLGKAIDGSIVIKTLESMPHLLVAWATGSGKSVGVNDFILSLMYQNTPSELKFLMVDPKQVELELYSGLPYMLAPIVFESEKALKLLKRTVQEMENRYTLLREKRVKNITEYNSKLIGEKMFRIVFVIDELADMMMWWHKKDVETCITRIAQKARAVWIHLIVATQRPSVNVITGLIKANIPTRIAFWVVSEIDSRTILGRKWAETLLWKWDMLYIDPSTKFPVRIQAPYVTTEEIEKVVQTLKNKYMDGLNEEDIYNQEIVQMLENKMETGDSIFSWWDAGNDEELVQQAIEVVSKTRKASATLLQRKLNVWFARAARIMDIMEERWIIGPQDGAKPRDIFI